MLSILMNVSARRFSLVCFHLTKAKAFQIQQIPGLETYETSWPAIIVDYLEVSGEL